MDRRKLHIFPWALLLLASLLAIGSIAVCVGVSFARYRTEAGWEQQFEVRQNGSVLLGQMIDGVFSDTEGTWVRSEGQLTLDFAVSNGTADAHSDMDQQVSLRVIASLSAGTQQTLSRLTLTVDGETYTATAEAIRRGSSLYRSFGDGWILRFLGEDGQELSWTLAGDAQNHIEMRLSMDETLLEDTSLLQLQLLGEEK